MHVEMPPVAEPQRCHKARCGSVKRKLPLRIERNVTALCAQADKGKNRICCGSPSWVLILAAQVISHVVIGLRTVKGTKQLKLDPTIYDALQKEKVHPGDVIYIEANSGVKTGSFKVLRTDRVWLRPVHMFPGKVLTPQGWQRCANPIELMPIPGTSLAGRAVKASE